MNICKKICAFLFFSLCTVALFAENIVFSCIQNENSYERASEITTKLEDYIFASCFDLGLIAGNVPIVVTDETTQESIAAVMEVLESPSEYILVVKTFYNSEASVDSHTNEKFATLTKVSYSLFRSSDNKIVFTKETKLPTVKTKSDLLKQLEKLNTTMMKTVAKKIG